MIDFLRKFREREREKKRNRQYTKSYWVDPSPGGGWELWMAIWDPKSTNAEPEDYSPIHYYRSEEEALYDLISYQESEIERRLANRSRLELLQALLAKRGKKVATVGCTSHVLVDTRSLPLMSH